MQKLHKLSSLSTWTIFLIIPPGIETNTCTNSVNTLYNIFFFFKGCKVAIASRNFDRLSHVAKSLSQIGDVQPFELNIRKEDEVKYVTLSKNEWQRVHKKFHYDPLKVS